jgi:hypothetical protein
VNEFVEECRREWKRLRVPDPVANEMAADLEADLKEAEAEGASAEEVLGSGAFDPRSFAASWAAERGVAEPLRLTEGPPPMAGWTPIWRTRTLAALTISGLIAIIGAALALHRIGSSQAIAASPFVRQVPIPPAPAGMRVFPLQLVGPGGYAAVFGLVLLLAGLAGLALTVLYWSRHRPYGNQTPGGPSYF